jgi:S1-C subfamily serine protease
LRAVIEGESLILGGDIILEVQGIPLVGGGTSYKVIREELSSLRPGSEVKVIVLRDGRKQELTMQVPEPQK